MKQQEKVFSRKLPCQSLPTSKLRSGEPSQLSEKSIRHALLRHLHVKNVVGIDIQRDLAFVEKLFLSIKTL